MRGRTCEAVRARSPVRTRTARLKKQSKTREFARPYARPLCGRTHLCAGAHDSCAGALIFPVPTKLRPHTTMRGRTHIVCGRTGLMCGRARLGLRFICALLSKSLSFVWSHIYIDGTLCKKGGIYYAIFLVSLGELLSLRVRLGVSLSSLGVV